MHINKAHPFFDVLYAALLQSPGGTRAKEAVDLLLITLARAEATAETPAAAQRYAHQRQQRWSPFLASALASLRQRLPLDDEEGAASR